MPHLSPLYRFSDFFVCGFRFWQNFFAVLRFWMIFSSVLRFLIHPNVPLLAVMFLENRKLNETYLKSMFDWDSAESSVAQEVT